MSDSRRLVVRLYEALASGDAAGIDSVLVPAFVGTTADGLPLGLGGTYEGSESMRRDFWWEVGRHFRVEAVVDEMADLPDDGVLVSGTYRGTARRSGRPLEAAFTHRFTFAGGRISSLVQLTDTHAWHEALGNDEAARRLTYDVRDGVARVVLDRPAMRNAIDLAVAEEFLDAVRAIEADPTVRAVLIAGNGASLSVGGDITFFEQGAADLGTLLARMTTPFHEAFRILSRIDAPIVTAAHGAVAGGGLGFVYAADVVLAATDARFVTAFADLGVSGDGGGTWHLPRLIGPARAARVLLENRPITADEALDWGLVSELVPPAELRERAERVAVHLASGPTKAYGHMRRLLRRGATSDLASQLQAETDALTDCGRSVDTRRAVSAFLNNQRPTFQGR
ncbi:enoyl-CoA hydratase-related protein [Nocardioides immobilis]|nr:enoyl-CoA hydratase-related protein [Nocardioides immobilis]